MPSPSRVIERARPLLGTVVRIRVEGLDPAVAHAAISGAFRLIEDIHRLMSFHSPDSELTALNRLAARSPVTVSAHTWAVLSQAVEIARASGGVFDPTVAPALVAAGLTPEPDVDWPDPSADWTDIRLGADGEVAFTRPLWIDLGGIAKGYAVDCAVDHLERRRPTRLCVEAGGDLRLAGPGTERVYLAAPQMSAEQPMLEVENASIASSGSLPSPHGADGDWTSPHIDPRTRAPCRTDRFVTVVARRCMDADALTKVVMAAAAASAGVLARRQAQAFLYDGSSWTHLGGTA